MDSRALKSNVPLVEVLAQLDLGGQSQGAISKLPNEMLRAILGRVQAHHLIRLRLVNKKLKVVVENILRDKKGLVMTRSYYKDSLLKLSERLNGHFKWNRNFVFIRLFNSRTGIHLSGKLCALLAKLFPNIEQFFISDTFSYSSPEFASMLRQWSSTLNTLSLCGDLNGRFTDLCGPINDLCGPINDMVNLKKFDMAAFPSEIITQLAPTFARLEHLSVCTIEDVIMCLPNLLTEITSLGISNVALGNLTKLNLLFGQFVSSLESLSLHFPYDNALPFICQHFTSLRILRFDCLIITLTTDMIEHLARLTHLTDLRIEFIHVVMAALDAANLVPLRNIRTFSLVDFRILSPNFDIHQFSRVLSTIFPNVENLTVKSLYYPMFGNVLEPHVNLFVNLRSHDFGLTDPIDRLLD